MVHAQGKDRRKHDHSWKAPLLHGILCDGHDVPCDVAIPSKRETAHVHKCTNSTSSDIGAVDPQRIIVAYGATLIGEPVTNGFGIAAAQIQSLHEIGLLCRGCATVRVVLTHAINSPLIQGNNSEIEEKEASGQGRSRSTLPPSSGGTGDGDVIAADLPSSAEAISSLTKLVRDLSGGGNGGAATVRVVRGNHWEWPALSDAHNLATLEHDHAPFSNAGGRSSSHEKDTANFVPAQSTTTGSGGVRRKLVLYFHNKGATHFSDSSGPITTMAEKASNQVDGGNVNAKKTIFAGGACASSGSSDGPGDKGERHHFDDGNNKKKRKSADHGRSGGDGGSRLSSLAGKMGGASLSSGFGRRSLYEMAAFHEVVSPWRSVVLVFDQLGDKVQHAGLAPATGGFEWFNFFWARPAYLASRKAPKRPHSGLDRHYYESWLGKAPLNMSSSSSLAGSEGAGQQGGCALAYSLSECAVGVCGQARWAESRMKHARKTVDTDMRRERYTRRISEADAEPRVVGAETGGGVCSCCAVPLR